MIDTKELRIGNLVTIRDNHRPREIVAISGSWVDMRFPCGAKETYPDNKLVPIPLTAELLLKCGFRQFEGDGTYHQDPMGVWRIIYSETEKACSWASDNFPEFGHRIYLPIRLESLHQLQNLYFALTGEELVLSQ